MNFFKYHFLKKFWHNRRQGWITAAVLLVAFIFLVYFRPANLWIRTLINENLLISFSITALLLIKFVISRILYVSKIKDGDVNARGCANSSCLLTILLAILLTILTIKGCKRHLNLKPQVETPSELATAENRSISPTTKPVTTNASHNATTMASTSLNTK